MGWTVEICAFDYLCLEVVIGTLHLFQLPDRQELDEHAGSVGALTHAIDWDCIPRIRLMEQVTVEQEAPEGSPHAVELCWRGT